MKRYIESTQLNKKEGEGMKEEEVWLMTMSSGDEFLLVGRTVFEEIVQGLQNRSLLDTPMTNFFGKDFVIHIERIESIIRASWESECVVRLYKEGKVFVSTG